MPSGNWSLDNAFQYGQRIANIGGNILIKSDEDKNVLETFFEELTHVEKHHRSLVIIANGYIELFINSIIDEAIEKAYNGVNAISFDKAQYRTDIGKK